MAKTSFAIRVAAGTPEGKISSGIWRIWKAEGKNKDDIYIAVRSLANQMKCSLHAVRNGVRQCQVGLTNDFHGQLIKQGRPTSPIRHWEKWERPDTPEKRYFCAAEIWFLPGPLRDPGDSIDKKTYILESPPSGKASVVSIFYSRVPEGELAIPHDTKELGYVRLTTGEFVVVFARPVDFDYEEFKARYFPLMKASISTGQTYISKSDMDRVNLNDLLHLRLFMTNNPKEDGVLRIFDVDPKDWPLLKP